MRRQPLVGLCAFAIALAVGGSVSAGTISLSLRDLDGLIIPGQDRTYFKVTVTVPNGPILEAEQAAGGTMTPPRDPRIRLTFIPAVSGVPTTPRFEVWLDNRLFPVGAKNAAITLETVLGGGRVSPAPLQSIIGSVDSSIALAYPLLPPVTCYHVCPQYYYVYYCAQPVYYYAPAGCWNSGGHVGWFRR
jgi:hypothetical protein